ncbi:hypothetical protein GJ744_010502 [Endocarpon pusillum]|uniref:Uncharacterized protein n=1 Tax=Endocarpon pusillum TaxID=364733 RepID=A0A8H7A6S9_9EURO|nr:hypothetical protein GJ744_010502 [Endocarpon pusillum]
MSNNHAYPEPPQDSQQSQLELLIAALSVLQNQNQTPVKSEKTADVPIFTGTDSYIQEDLERFKIGLDSKFKVNTDRYLTLESRIYYVFARITDRAASIILDSIRKEKYKD